RSSDLTAAGCPRSRTATTSAASGSARSSTTCSAACARWSTAQARPPETFRLPPRARPFTRRRSSATWQATGETSPPAAPGLLSTFLRHRRLGRRHDGQRVPLGPRRALVFVQLVLHLAHADAQDLGRAAGRPAG